MTNPKTGDEVSFTITGRIIELMGKTAIVRDSSGYQHQRPIATLEKISTQAIIDKAATLPK